MNMIVRPLRNRDALGTEVLDAHLRQCGSSIGKRSRLVVKTVHALATTWPQPLCRLAFGVMSNCFSWSDREFLQ